MVMQPRGYIIECLERCGVQLFSSYPINIFLCDGCKLRVDNKLPFYNQLEDNPSGV